MSFIAELKRRNVLRVAAAYLAGAWLLLQVADTVFPIYGFGNNALLLLTTALAIGFPLALLFSWVFELTPDGLRRESNVDRSRPVTPQTGKWLDRLIILLLTLALGYFAVDKFVLDPVRDATMLAEATEEARTQALLESYGEKSIAVLPFADLSPEQDQEYFADGISEELLNLLAGISELRVISRSSAFSFKGEKLDISTIAERLNVVHVLEGSVRKSGMKVRIAAQLIDARSDTQLWSETYDREFVNLLAIQEDIAEAVVEQLEVRLLGEKPEILPVDPDAYALFLQGRHFVNQGSAEGYRLGEEYLRKAASLDPDYAPAWAELSRSLGNQALSSVGEREEKLAQAWAAVQEAYALAPNDAIINSRISWYLMMVKDDLPGAAGYAAKAMALEPGSAAVLANSAVVSAVLGRIEQAVSLQQLAVERDPVAPLMHVNLARGYIDLGRYDMAEKSARQALLLSAEGFGIHEMIARVLRLKGQYPQALQAIDKEPVPFLRLGGKAMIHYRMGDLAASDAALQQLKARYAGVAAGVIATVYATRGQNDEALAWVKTALESEGLRAISPFRSGPEYESLRQDPRWEELMSSAGISQAQADAIPFEIELPTGAVTG